MKLEDLGYGSHQENHRLEQNLSISEIGRIISEHKERYIVRTEGGEFEAEITGNLRFTARDRSDFPAVGDWVAIAEYDEEKLLIREIFPRKTVIERAAVGKQGSTQVIAANIDHALIIQAVDRDYNMNRMERYLALCTHAEVNPILVFSKIDLIPEEDLNQKLDAAKNRSGASTVIGISNETKAGYNKLMEHIIKGKTYCLLGSSGVGKSTLINNLSGRPLMKTDSISESTRKGKHVTSHRELVIMENGGILIDNPGMREVGITDAADGLEMVFSDIALLSGNCRFTDCTHIHESGCAIIQALNNGDIDRSHYENYLKMVRERNHYESTLTEKRRKDRNLSKIVRDFKKFKKRNES